MMIKISYSGYLSLLKNLSCTKTCPVWESVCR